MVPESTYNVELDPLRAHVVAAAVGILRKHPHWLPGKALKTVAARSLKYRVYCGAHTNGQFFTLLQEIDNARRRR